MPIKYRTMVNISRREMVSALLTHSRQTVKMDIILTQYSRIVRAVVLKSVYLAVTDDKWLRMMNRRGAQSVALFFSEEPILHFSTYIFSTHAHTFIKHSPF